MGQGGLCPSAEQVADIGVFGSEVPCGGLDDSATGQVLGSVGYNWTPSFSTTLGYRVLYTYFRDESGPLHDFRYQSWMYGPFAGAKYSF